MAVATGARIFPIPPAREAVPRRIPRPRGLAKKAKILRVNVVLPVPGPSLRQSRGPPSQELHQRLLRWADRSLGTGRWWRFLHRRPLLQWSTCGIRQSGRHRRGHLDSLKEPISGRDIVDQRPAQGMRIGPGDVPIVGELLTVTPQHFFDLRIARQLAKHVVKRAYGAEGRCPCPAAGSRRRDFAIRLPGRGIRQTRSSRAAMAAAWLPSGPQLQARFFRGELDRGRGNLGTTRAEQPRRRSRR